MGSSHYGDLGLQGSSKSGSSRKGKKSNSEKPKQPQRGLGVAQLEKIRLQTQMASYLSPFQPPFIPQLNMEEDMNLQMSYSQSPTSSAAAASSSSLFGLHHNTLMDFRDTGRIDSIYSTFPSIPTNSNPYQPHHFAQPAVTLPLLDQTMEDSAQSKRRHDRRHSTGSISHNLDSSDTEELDLDLKLSL